MGSRAMRKLIARSSGRTPLFSSAKRWMQDAHIANVTGLHPEEILAKRKEGISRRQALKVAGVGAASLALGSKLAWAANGPKIVVVGGGMAGLNASYQLKQKGFRADVYEGSSRIGGRMYTARNVMGSGLNTELGGEFIDTIHKDMKQLAKEFHLDLHDF